MPCYSPSYSGRMHGCAGHGNKNLFAPQAQHTQHQNDGLEASTVPTVWKATRGSVSNQRISEASEAVRGSTPKRVGRALSNVKGEPPSFTIVCRQRVRVGFVCTAVGEARVGAGHQMGG